MYLRLYLRREARDEGEAPRAPCRRKDTTNQNAGQRSQSTTPTRNGRRRGRRQNPICNRWFYRPRFSGWI